MPATPTTPQLGQAHFDRLREIIYDRSGIHFPDGKKYVLESRLGQRLAELGVEDYGQYIAFLTTGPYQSDEFQEMFNRITINETSFFRNEPQLNAFETRVLPELLEARASSKRLRIWSAACSTGEEPYTIAIMLHRMLGVRLADWRIEILGTDISERAINAAATGSYSDYAVRSTPQTIRTRYFKSVGRQHELDPTIRDMVTFDKHNLRDTLGAKRYGNWDVIFCRNVTIYFDQEMRQRVAGMFYDQIADDGRLFIGHSETLRGLGVPFEPLPIPQAFCYTKAV
ncbi:MAG: CheR family methyltransferase [Planctomycetota bacterium]